MIDGGQSGSLGIIERIGNRLPDPVALFAIGAVVVAIVSWMTTLLGWSVQPVTPVLVTSEGASPRVSLVATGTPIRAQSILSREGLYWAASSSVRNFTGFPPLGIVLVAVLGVGASEKLGLLSTFIRWLAGIVPHRFLTPAVLLLGMLSHIGTDAGFVILPPLAAGLFRAAGRSPIAGVAAAFAGVGGGFSANLLLSPSDALMAGLTTSAAQVLDKSYSVAVTCNWWFLIASTVMLVAVGWLVTERWVEPRLAGTRREFLADVREEGYPSRALTQAEKSGLVAAGLTAAGLLIVVIAACVLPSGPLYGIAPGVAVATPRWTQAIVPIILVLFLSAGTAYGVRSGEVRSAGDVSRALVHAVTSMAPMIVMAFFAAQFIEYFKYSNLDRMLAYVGGTALVRLGLPTTPLLVVLVLVIASINMCIASMSAKWSMLAPILVPMLMLAGVSPELAQASYRVGDSVTNIITPLNPYLLIILVEIQRHQARAGIGSLISLMMPYTLAFLAAWLLLLLCWVWAGLPLGPGGPLWYAPMAA